MGSGVEGGGKEWMKLSVGDGGPSRGESMATTRSEASEMSSRRRSRSSDRDTGGGFYGFTRAQLEELSFQLLIFNKYLASASAPPPFQLLLPIFTSSFHHSSFHFHLLLLHYPLFALQPPPSPPWLDQRERMDQPGRCRRTDGKRWRCTKEVVPNEKYCSKHMHRGCGRSRKLVESSVEKPSNALNLNSADTACSHLNTANSSRDIKQEMQPCVDAMASNSNNTIRDLKIEEPKEQRGNDGVIKIAFKLASSALTNGKMETTERQHKLGNDNGCVYERVEEEKIIAEARNNKTKKSDAMAMEFSPKSVLQEGHSLPIANQNNTHSVAGDDFEHMRCRRTDGKRWRCRKEVIAEDQKYCAKHMHRGAKKRPVGFQGAECGEKANPFALVKRANKLVVGFDSNLKIMN